MSTDDLRLEVPAQTKKERGWLRTVLLMALPLAVVWGVAFWITGLLWWEAGDAVAQLPPPAAPQIEAVDPDVVNLERYKTAHPHWQP